ncbi:MAG: hypothetical protein R8K21_08650 [Mariprofundales bacterium]
MRQLLLELELGIDGNYYGAWVTHGQAQSVRHRLALWLQTGGRLWLTSAEECGKSHLLHLLQQTQANNVHLFATVPMLNDIKINKYNKKASHWLIDLPAGYLSKNDALTVFHMLERARSLQIHVLIAWRNTQENINNLPPELSSRLRAMQRCEMFATRDEKTLINILRTVAKARQWRISDDILALLLHQLPRRLHILIAGMKTLEYTSLEEHRRLNILWARKQLPNLIPESESQRLLFS